MSFQSDVIFHDAECQVTHLGSGNAAASLKSDETSHRVLLALFLTCNFLLNMFERYNFGIPWTGVQTCGYICDFRALICRFVWDRSKRCCGVSFRRCHRVDSRRPRTRVRKLPGSIIQLIRTGPHSSSSHFV